jgi:hypothetical protein
MRAAGIWLGDKQKQLARTPFSVTFGPSVCGLDSRKGRADSGLRVRAFATKSPGNLLETLLNSDARSDVGVGLL